MPRRLASVECAHFSDYLNFWPSGIEYGPKFDKIKPDDIVDLSKLLLDYCDFCRARGPAGELFIVRGESRKEVIIYRSLTDTKAHFRDRRGKKC